MANKPILRLLVFGWHVLSVLYSLWSHRSHRFRDGSSIRAMRQLRVHGSPHLLVEKYPVFQPSLRKNGEFTLPTDPGSYTLTLSADGFLDSSVQATSANNPSAVEVVLAVSGHRDTVTISESAGYQVISTNTATKTATPLLDTPQSIIVLTQELIKDQMMSSIPIQSL